jgi:hypothetical protein
MCGEDVQEGEHRIQEADFFVGDQAQEAGHSKRSPRKSAKYKTRPKFMSGFGWRHGASAQGLPEPNGGKGQGSGQ